MASEASWPTHGRLMKKLDRLGKLNFADVRPLLEEGERILIEGNRKKILSGMQGDGVTPMPAVTYRGQGKARKANARPGQQFGVPKFARKGRGVWASGLHDNLTSAEYKKLSGPPLAPRGEESRIIKNLDTAIGEEPAGSFYVAKMWVGVVSPRGNKFLKAHFTGFGRLPRRDARGISDAERKQFSRAVGKWGRWLLSGGG